MPNTIENNVVKMSFDNAQFERNVATSMKTLDSLKESLSFKGVQNGFESITKSANRVDFSGIQNGVLQVQASFSALEVVGMTVISNLTTSVMNAVAGAAKAVKSLIVGGGMGRAQKIIEAQFKLEGLGIQWADIEEDIAYGVNETAYGLDSAASAAAQFVASGVQLGDEMKTALRGIAGVAAMTGSSYDDIANVYTSIAGSNRLYATNLYQLSTRGLNATAVLAKHLNKTEAQIKDMTSKGAIDFKTFAEAMDEAYGEHAKKANDTVSGVLANIRAAFSKIGANFIQPIIANKGALVDFLETFRQKVNGVRDATKPLADAISGEAIPNLIKGLTSVLNYVDLSKMSFDKFAKNAKNGINNIAKVLTYLGAALKSTSSINAVLAGEEYERRWISVYKAAKKIANGIKSLSVAVNKFKQAGKDAFTTVFGSNKQIKSWKQTLLGMADGFNRFAVNLKFSTRPFETFKNLLASVLNIGAAVGTLISNVIVSAFIILRAVVSDSSGNLNEFSGSLLDLTTKFRNWVQNSKTFIDTAHKIADVIKEIKDHISEIVDGRMFEQFKDEPDAFAKGIESVSKAIEIFLTDFANLIEAIVGPNIFDSDAFKIGEALESITGPMAEYFRTGEKGNEVLKILNDSLDEFSKNLDEISKSDFGVILSGILTLASIGEQLTKAAGNIIAVLTGIKSFSSLGNGIGSIFEYIYNTIFDLASGKDIPVLSKLLGTLHNAISSLFAVLGESGAAIKESLQGLVDSLSLSELLGNAISLLFQIFAGFGQGLATIVVDVVNAVATGMSSITEAFTKAVSTGDLSTVLDAGILVLGLQKVLDIITQIKRVFAELGPMKLIKSMSDSLSAMSVTLKKMSTNLNAQYLLTLAGAILVLAFAMSIMSNVDVDKMVVSLGGVIVLLFVMMELFQQIAALKFNHLKVWEQSVTKPLKDMAVSILILALAMSVIGKLKPEQAAVGFFAIVGMLGVLLGAMWLLAKWNKNMLTGIMVIDSVSKAMIKLSISIVILSVAISMLSKLQPDELAIGLIGIGVMLLILDIFVKLLDSNKLMKIGDSLIALSIAVAILSVALKILSSLTPDGAFVGLISIGGLLLMIDIFTKLVDTKKLTRVSAVLTTIAIAITIMAVALKILSSLDLTGALISVGVVGAVLLELVLFSKFVESSNIEALGGAMLAISASLLILSFALKVVGSMDIDSVLVAVGAITGIILLMGIMSSIGDGKNLLLFGAGLLVVSIAIGVLTSSLIVLSALNPLRLALNILILGGAILGFAILAAALQAAIIPMLTLAGAIALLGISLVVLGAGMSAVGAGMVAIAAGIIALLETIIVIIKDFFTIFVVVFDGVGDVILSFWNMLKRLFGGWVPELFNSLKKGAIKLWEKSQEFVSDIMTKAKEKFKKDGSDTGGNFLQGLIDGIFEGLAGAIEAAVEAGKKIFEAFKSSKEGMNEHSPSANAYDVAVMFLQGYINGIKQNTGKAVSSVETAGASIYDAMKTALSMANAEAMDDLNPVISPVLDLSNVRSGSAALNSLFGGRTLSLAGGVSLYAGNQNGKNSGLESAINALSDRFSNGEINNYNVNGITYDDGSNVAGAVQTLVRATRMERRSR